MSMSNLIVWVDCETTGLNPHQDELVELALLVTDYHLKELDSLHLTLCVPSERWEKTDRVVHRMHGTSGLMERSIVAGLYLEQAESLAVAFLRKWFSSVKPPLAGRNPAFDRGFLQVHMPKVVALLHHHMIDVCTLYEMRRLYWEDLPAYDLPHAHLAMDDVRDAVKELRHYLKHLGVRT